MIEQSLKQERPLTILGIESSCDDSAAAIVRGMANEGIGEILSNVVFDQADLHQPYGGVVPDACRTARQHGF